MTQMPLEQRPRWKPIGQYRTFPLAILPILPPLKYIPYKVKAKVNPIVNSMVNQDKEADIK